MRKLEVRKDLPKDVEDALADLLIPFRVPAIVLKLKNYILTREESRLVGDKGITKPAEPKDWVSTRQILNVVARQRQLTLERTLLELARSLDMLGAGRYEQLRKAIGEPVVPERNDVPKWHPEAGELSYKGNVVRRLSIRATNGRRVLDAFQNDGWPPRIDSPLPGGKNSRSLRETVRTLNDGLARIKFFGDGTGEGIIWQDL